ncbi:MAG TPA: CidA/LrgA family protein [Thermoflexales bacterium]|jgi:holin-like protein|nr:CidA/LrgA family protein [Thermoflexales bacterium]HQX10435.1 CidA/LrgA family protein [Thermoflexales bacterium]HQY23643.1 CidA/LrgA family protein [Thermoflexales bacterium]HQZ54976.1 CidA/LrgA family protein [Thermoflexales bacterium]HRA52697.1 CidA/LrgA family protein [Thermoflexales bacterium]
MLASLALLLGYQLVGEVVARALNLPIPGPVIGMLLLLLTLIIRGQAPEPLKRLSHELLQHLALLFVPAGVGIIAHFQLLQAEWVSLTLALVISLILTLAVTALSMKALTGR